MYLILKFALSAGVLVAVSELAKRSSFAAALLASLPLTTLLAMVWLYLDTGDVQKVAVLSSSVLWLVLPSLVLLAVLPILLKRGVPLWPSLAVASACTVMAYAVMVPVLRRFGISL